MFHMPVFLSTLHKNTIKKRNNSELIMNSGRALNFMVELVA